MTLAFILGLLRGIRETLSKRDKSSRGPISDLAQELRPDSNSRGKFFSTVIAHAAESLHSFTPELEKLRLQMYSPDTTSNEHVRNSRLARRFAGFAMSEVSLFFNQLTTHPDLQKGDVQIYVHRG